MPFKPVPSDAFREAEGRYNEALRRLQAAVAAQEDPAVLQQLKRELELQKRSMRAAAKRPDGRVEKPEWKSYPQPVEVPRCSRDPRFVRSFEVADAQAASSFFDEYGFVVFQDVLDTDECEATVVEIWAYLEERHPGLGRRDPATWERLSAERYGLPEAQAIFTPQIMRNRESPRVYAALDAVLPRAEEAEEWDSPHPSPNSVVISQDRWCIYRPTEANPDWKTAENLHLDVNPWTYMGEEPSYKDCMRYGIDEEDPMADGRLPLRDFRAEITSVQDCTGLHVQGVLNLLDNLQEDGGTRVVPGFHKAFLPWFRALGPLEQNLFQSGPHDNFVLRRAHGGGSFKFSNLDPIHELSRRVPMRAGSLLIWNQLVVHGSVANSSSSFRMAQFVTGFRAAELAPARARARREAVLRQVIANGLTLGPLAPHVFGLSQEEVDEARSGTERGNLPPDRAPARAGAAREAPSFAGPAGICEASTAVAAAAGAGAAAAPSAEEAAPRSETRHFCEICQLSWQLAEGEEARRSWEMHVAGRTHRKRLLAPRVPAAGASGAGAVAAGGGCPASSSGAPPPAWASLRPQGTVGSRDPPAGSLVQFWPWPGTDAAFDKLAHAFALRLSKMGCRPPCDAVGRGAGPPPPPGDGASDAEGRARPQDPEPGAEVGAPDRADAARRCAVKASAMQDQMRRCAQQAEDFEDSEALWGYVAAKFALRAGMAFNALARRAPPPLQGLLAPGGVGVASLGGGPGAELLAAVVARDVAGGSGGRLAVFEWVDGWRPMVDALGELLGEKVEYHHCDVSLPLGHQANAALRGALADFGLLIFSHVLLECGRGGAAPVELLRDVWTDFQGVRHILVLDAGQARGRDCKSRPLAGSLRDVEALAAELGAGLLRVQGAKHTDGVLLFRDADRPP